MRHHSVIIQAVTAMRMYRGLIDSPVVNCPVVGVIGTDLKGLSTKSEIKFAVPPRPGCREDTLGTRDLHEPNYLAPSPQRFMFITKHEDQSESFGSQTV
jgi:hypothetical protein